MFRLHSRVLQEVLSHTARMRAATSTSSSQQNASSHRRSGVEHNRRQSLSRRPAASAARSEPQVIEAECPGCRAMNEFTAPDTCPEQVTVRCFSCSVVFGVRMPLPPEPRRLTDLYVCPNCGEINHYSSPEIGSPWPDVQCGSCGHVLTGTETFSQRHRRHLQLVAAAVREHAHRYRGSPTQPIDAADDADIAALPIQKVTGDESRLGEQSSCTICMEDFKVGDDVKTLPCLHLYHMDCIDAWLRHGNDCPICKTCIGKDCCGGDSSFHSSSKQGMAGSDGAF